MTDEQIVNWWKDEISIAECFKSDYRDGIKVDVIKRTVDLIKRKDAEIDRLKTVEQQLTATTAVYLKQKAEIEMLKEVTTNTINTSIEFGLDKENQINKAKSEAIKEYVTKYKDHIKSFTGMFSPEMGFMVNLDAILFAVDFVADNLLKEMAGDEDA